MQRLRHAIVTLGATLAVSCADSGPTQPPKATLRVSVRVTGVGIDERGFSIVVNSQVLRNIVVDTSVTVSHVVSGTYVIALTRIADTCTISGAHPRTISVAPGQVADITFDVECTGTEIAVTTRTTGANSGSYRVVIDDVTALPIAASGTLRTTKLQPGLHTIALARPTERCVPTSPAQVIVDLVPARLTSVRFDVTCGPFVPASKIAYSNDTTAWGTRGRWISMMNADGSGGHVLALGDRATWSPDGQTLAYSDAECVNASLDVACGGRVFMVDPETWSTRDYGAFGYAVRDLAWNPRPTAGILAAALCCDAGGPRLGMIDLGDLWTWAIPIQGAELVRFPRWVPNGFEVVFSCVVSRSPGTPDTGWDVCKVDAAGGRVKRLTSDAGDELHPAPSPDGTRIAFTRGSDVALMSADGQGVAALTPGSEPAWSPDGRRLVFVGENGLFTIDADGSNRRRLTTGTHRSPAWRP